MRVAVFDLDGTLADTSGDLIAAANATLLAIGLAPALDPERDRLVAFRGGRAMLREGLTALGEPWTEARIEALYPRLLGFYREAMDVHTRLYAGVEASLERLAADGWRLGVCTNKPAGLAEPLLVRLGIRSRFGVMLGADSLPVRKPDPRHLLEVIGRLGGRPERAVLIGDNATDRETARAAAVACILVGFGPEGPGIARLRPAALLERYEDLPAMLDRLVPPPIPA